MNLIFLLSRATGPHSKNGVEEATKSYSLNSLHQGITHLAISKRYDSNLEEEFDI